MNAKFQCTMLAATMPMHLSQPVTGFFLLKRDRLIDIKVERIHSNDLAKNMMTVIVNGSIRVLYDMDDGYIDMDNGMVAYDRILDAHDVCFKRSFNRSRNDLLRNGRKIRPYGLHYNVTARNSLANMPAPLDSRTDKLKMLLRHIPGTSYGYRNFMVDSFEELPFRQNNPTVLFLTRVWDLPRHTHANTQEEKDEYAEINRSRTACIMKCRDEFGDLFFGGLQPTALALEKFKEAALTDKDIFRRSNYIARMKSSEICVTSIGLSQSNGWKLAEYVAAAKAIVTEPLFYEVPGSFNDPDNYLTFKDADTCVAQIGRLIGNPDLRYRMKAANCRYYHEYMRPDRIILNTLLQLL